MCFLEVVFGIYCWRPLSSAKRPIIGRFQLLERILLIVVIIHLTSENTVLWCTKSRICRRRPLVLCLFSWLTSTIYRFSPWLHLYQSLFALQYVLYNPLSVPAVSLENGVIVSLWERSGVLTPEDVPYGKCW